VKHNDEGGGIITLKLEIVFARRLGETIKSDSEESQSKFSKPKPAELLTLDYIASGLNETRQQQSRREKPQKPRREGFEFIVGKRS
jgi:hypothetical protein